MNSKSITLRLIGIIVLIIGGGFLLLLSNDSNNDEESTPNNENQIVQQDSNSVNSDSSAQNDTANLNENIANSPSDENTAATNESGIYTLYNGTEQLDASKRNVLFFRAKWCPTCNALDTNLKNNADSIPSDVQVLEIDYDNSSELKKKYGVTIQHTLVLVDVNGNELKQWSGGDTLNSILNQI